MEAEWKTIVFTAPEATEGEARRITMMLVCGHADIVHLRKPGYSRRQMRDLLLEIPGELHPQLRLHDHFDLLDEFPGVGGVHLNSRNPEAPAQARCVSRSCHTLEELKGAEGYDYVTLSPIYDSISKPGYRSAFDTERLRGAIGRGRVIALGGVTPDRFAELRDMGFAGAALLGYIREGGPEREAAAGKAGRLLRRFGLQFVTDGRTAEETVSQVYDAVAGGCRWVQVRMKEADDAEVAEALRRVRQVCSATGTTLLVDDRVGLAAEGLSDGVHLGKEDMPAAEARALLGELAIVGCTANSEEDVRRIADGGGADYIGMGPYRFTTTKKRLAPVLGAEGYRRVTAWMRANGIYLPVTAIGGITAEDIAELKGCGVQGVAVSGAIAHAPDRVAATRELIRKLNDI